MTVQTKEAGLAYRAESKAPAVSAELPLERRLCRAEFHLECMETTGKRWREFLGMPIEDFVDFVAERVGTQVWYTTLPRSGQFSALLPTYYDKEDVREADVPQDIVARFVKRAHEQGILVVSCFKMNLWPSLGRMRPEWLIQDIPDGRDIKPNDRYMCHNSPFGDWLIEYLIDQVQRDDLDGVWFDDTQYGSRGAWPFPAGCLCRWCAEQYLRDSGSPLPQVVDWNSDPFKHWVNWRYDNLRRYQRRLADAIQAARPGAIVNYNSYPRAMLPWSSANDLNPADANTIFFIETDYRRMGPTLTAKIAAAARGNCEIWAHLPQLAGIDESHLGGDPHMDPEFAAKFSFAGFANGVQVQSIASYLNPARVPAYAYAELNRRADYFGGESIRECAVHVSRSTRDFYYITDYTSPPSLGANRSKEVTETDQFWKQITGITEMLEQTHIVHDLLFDASLTPEGLDQYRALILPNSACLSDAQCDAIRKWVAGGGTLIATFESSLYDELGHRRANFALADVFGVDYFARYGEEGTIYVPHGELAHRFGQWFGFSGPYSVIRARRDSRIETFCTHSIRRQFKPIDLSAAAPDSGHPGVTSNRFGEGRAIYISGDMGIGFADHPLPVVRSFFEELVRHGRLRLNVEAPVDLQVTAFVQPGGEWNIHLYHRFCPMMPWEISHPNAQQWAALQKPQAARGVRINLPSARVSDAAMPLQERKLQIEGDGSSFIVPEVYLHDVVVVRFEQ